MIKTIRKRHGIVVILDALGASSYSDEKIKRFLAARSFLNEVLANLSKQLNNISKLKKPNTYTFGDTLIVVQEFGKTDIGTQLLAFFMLMQNYLYHSMEEGILFRGALSVGSYIEDNGSNTVMGEAIADAASWYEKSDWMGLSSTPRTNNFLEYYLESSDLNDPNFIVYYPVPMKDGRKIDLYTVSWAGRFSHDEKEVPSPRRRFLELLKDLPVPLGTESKFENTKKYFTYVETQIVEMPIEHQS